MTPLIALLSLSSTAQPLGPAPAPLPDRAESAPVRSAPLPAPPPDRTRYRCKVAGAVLLASAGAAIVSVLSVVIYRAATTPDQVTLEAGPRLGFGLSAVALTVAGSALLGYGLSTPAPTPAPAPAPGAAPVALVGFRF